jgi:hypothetical protein
MSLNGYLRWLPHDIEPISEERIERIRQVKRENPDANQKWIATMTFDSKYAVGAALKDYDPEEQLNST